MLRSVMSWRAVPATVALAVSMVLTSGFLTPVLAKPICIPPAGLVQLGGPLPVLKGALDRGALDADAPVRIVALGSSSTAGAGASGRDQTYPARLAHRLRMRFPGQRFEIYNRGKGGELATHMLARLDQDVLSLQPHLVIWQTGVNDAIRRVDQAAFRKTVEAGLARMRAAGIDVVLVDQQYYPRSIKVQGYRKYLHLVRAIGVEHGVPVFRRYQLMTHLVETAQYDVDDLLAPDRFHLNDRSYACVGRVLADALATTVMR
ncbi:MAG: SGNH/GDSL hydrolase family protein [Pseudomonadota bacterium]